MKGISWSLIVALCCWPWMTVLAQEPPGNRYLFRLYEDNDAMNLYDIGSDKGYTNGTRLDFFWTRNKKAFLLPQAGPGSINAHSWSLMQLMITPDNILRRWPDPTDYPYSGALFVTRGLHSANPVKKLSFHSEWLLGVMGPPSLAEATQVLIHQIIQAQRPRGWNYQMPTNLLLNYNFTASKQLVQPRPWMEVIGNAQGFAGTMLNGVTLSSTIRLGRMNPYFNGFIQQFSTDNQQAKRWQFYFILQPAVELVFQNALLDGGVFDHDPKLPPPGYEGQRYAASLKRNSLITRFDIGAVLSKGNVAVSFTQKSATAPMKGLSRQEVGNVSLHIAW